MNSKTQLIAETDENGFVICVWHQAPNERVAHPVVSGRVFQIDTEGVSYHGASSESIGDFLKRQHIRDRGRVQR